MWIWPAVWLALCSTSVTAATALGNLDIWYDETPVQMGDGTTTWRGRASVPLTRDDKTGKITGKSTFVYSYTGEGSGCTLKCDATTGMSVVGKASLTTTDFEVTAQRTTANCSVRCPKGAAMAHQQADEAYTHRVSLPVGMTKPLRQVVVAGGPAVFFQMGQACPAESDKDIAVTATPGDGKWEVTWLRFSSLGGIRTQPPPNPKRYGYTKHDFATTLKVVDKVKPAKGGGFCYWVESIDFAFAPIEVALPGASYPDNSCEMRESQAHEEDHVKNYKGLLSSYALALKSKALTGGLPPPSAPIHIKTLAGGHDLSVQKLQGWIDQLHPEWVDKRIKRDAGLDKDSEMARIKASCDWAERP
jgi:hypothetical protein